MAAAAAEQAAMMVGVGAAAAVGEGGVASAVGEGKVECVPESRCVERVERAFLCG